MAVALVALWVSRLSGRSFSAGFVFVARTRIGRPVRRRAVINPMLPMEMHLEPQSPLCKGPPPTSAAGS
ncbi:hypothetical protein M8494_35935 [Serratia ureilytica]